MSLYNYKHGYSSSPLYETYNAMIKRCYSISNIGYSDYGGRGIKVCDEWLNDNRTFFEWAENNGWKEGLQIDRIDNNGNYTPENCKFSTIAENARNRRTTKLTMEKAREIRKLYKETKMPQRKLAKQFNVSRSAIAGIIQNIRWKEN